MTDTPDTKDKAREHALSPKQQLRNLIEGLCEEPFWLDSPEDEKSNSELEHAKQELIDFTFRHAQFGSSTALTESLGISDSHKRKH